MGFGQGSAGTNGNGFQLLVIIFMELFGGTYLSVSRFAGLIAKSCFSELGTVDRCHLPQHPGRYLAALPK